MYYLYLRHRAAAAACAQLTVDAATAYGHCTPEDAVHTCITPADGLLAQPLPKFKVFYKSF